MFSLREKVCLLKYAIHYYLVQRLIYVNNCSIALDKMIEKGC
jgi:hypothetical protein